MQGIQGRSRSRLLQVLDNAANERLGLARRVKIFEKLSRKVSGTNCHLPTISKIANNKPFSLTIKRTLKNFHEIFGLGLLEDIEKNLKQISPLRITMVRGSEFEPLFNGFIEAYHYLGYCQIVGAHLKYIAFAQERPLACLSFGSAAWKVSCLSLIHI